jgi:superfamily I DNA and/or RNA helicase
MLFSVFFYIFVCDLFSNADSSADYILPKEKMRLLVMHNKMKEKWAEASNLEIYSGILLEKTKYRIAGVWTDI